MDHIQQLLHKEMSRKEFLTMLGFGLATLAGLSSILGLMGKTNPWQTRHGRQLNYGGGPYGGGSRQL